MSSSSPPMATLVGLGLSAVVGGFLFGRWSAQNREEKETVGSKVVGESEMDEKVQEEAPKLINFAALGMEYIDTNGHMHYKWTIENGKWSKGEFVKDPYHKAHVMSGVFHYGRTLFEGLKAYRTKDGQVVVFNLEASIARLKLGCARLLMPEVPAELFTEAVDRAISENVEYLPPYGFDGAFYVRPVIYASGPVGRSHQPNSEFTFNVIVFPIGQHPAGGKGLKKVCVSQDYDRAAPRGVGNIKIGGNYAADRLPASENMKKGFASTLYLDAKENKYIEEFSTSNFIAIDKDGHYVTPDSQSILKSNTNKVLQQLARDNGLQVFVREIAWEEVATLKEVASCGTSLIVTPVGSITNGDEVVEFEGCETFLKLREQLIAIQRGEVEDRHGWLHYVNV